MIKLHARRTTRPVAPFGSFFKTVPEIFTEARSDRENGPIGHHAVMERFSRRGPPWYPRFHKKPTVDCLGSRKTTCAAIGEDVAREGTGKLPEEIYREASKMLQSKHSTVRRSRVGYACPSWL